MAKRGRPPNTKELDCASLHGHCAGADYLRLLAALLRHTSTTDKRPLRLAGDDAWALTTRLDEIAREMEDLRHALLITPG